LISDNVGIRKPTRNPIRNVARLPQFFNRSCNLSNTSEKKEVENMVSRKHTMLLGTLNVSSSRKTTNVIEAVSDPSRRAKLFGFEPLSSLSLANIFIRYLTFFQSI
jgi:hypothetical protein